MIERLTAEWDEAQLALKRHELVTKAAVTAQAILRALLALAAIGGVCAVAMIAPNVFSAFSGSRRQFFPGQPVRGVLKYALRRRYLRRGSESNTFSLTAQGMRWLAGDFIRKLRPREPKVPTDRATRLVMFDIPRRHNAERNGFREHLRSMGLRQLQASVFLSDRPCEEEVRFLARLWSISAYVAIAYADRIERVDAEVMVKR